MQIPKSESKKFSILCIFKGTICSSEKVRLKETVRSAQLKNIGNIHTWGRVIAWRRVIIKTGQVIIQIIKELNWTGLFKWIILLTLNEGQPGKSEDVKSWRGSSSVAFSSQPTRSQLLNPETQKESERRFCHVYKNCTLQPKHKLSKVWSKFETILQR
jgi:hypothetical protein